MLSLRLGRSRTCPMLALTTTAEPRNLLIDFGFALEAARFGVFASGGASGLDGALADLRATGSPYPLARRPLRNSRRGESDHSGRPVGSEVCIGSGDGSCYTTSRAGPSKTCALQLASVSGHVKG